MLLYVLLDINDIYRYVMNDVKDNMVNNNFFYKRDNNNIKGKIFNNNNGVEIRVYNNNKDNVFNNIDI